jgi:hypothetical protein
MGRELRYSLGRRGNNCKIVEIRLASKREEQ